MYKQRPWLAAHATDGVNEDPKSRGISLAFKLCSIEAKSVSVSGDRECHHEKILHISPVKYIFNIIEFRPRFTYLFYSCFVLMTYLTN